MADRKRRPQPLRILLNDSTRSFWADQGILAERTFQETREDRHAPSPKADAERRSLYRELSLSCRKTAELLARYKTDNRGFTIPEMNTILGYSLISLTELAVALRPFWDGAEQSVGGVDKALEMLAQYFEIMRTRPAGRRPDRALTALIQGKLVAWLASRGDRNICSWNTKRQRFEGDFLEEMEQILKRIGYKYQSRDALAQRIKAVQKRVVIFTSAEEAARGEIEEM